MNSYKRQLERERLAAEAEATSQEANDLAAAEAQLGEILRGPGELTPVMGAIGGRAPQVLADFDGDKFFGGFGPTKLFVPDYWTLRERSSQLFTENLYARGLIRRLITNEINIGLSPESVPDEGLIGVPEDSLTNWTESVENRFAIWAKDSNVCDYLQRDTFGALQRAARLEALAAGDVLVVLRQDPRTNLPMVHLVKGERVRTPLGGDENARRGHEIRHGVELDPRGRMVAYWVTQKDGTSKRIPAFGERSGRRLAWLVHGTEKRLDEVRGQPLLALVLQSLKEIDRYRDSAQRKAVINSIIAMFIKKTEDKPGSLPVTGGAVRKSEVNVVDPGLGSSESTSRSINVMAQMPGVVLEELQTGEEPVMLGGNGTDVNFGPFEEAIIQSIAWANELPPEILTLAFSNNYSASQAAINEFKIYLSKFWAVWGETFCQPIYIEWLVAEVLKGQINAPGLLDAWRDPNAYAQFGAWVAAEWYGTVKPSTDTLKQGKGSKLLVDEGWSTNAREARQLTGTKFTKNIKRIKRENELKAAAARPMLELKNEFGEQEAAEAIEDLELEAMAEHLDEYIEGAGAQ